MGMGGGGGSTPQPIQPGEAARAAVGAAGAGEMMSIANQPVEQYANLATMSQLGPAEQQTQSALQNQAALQSAQGQMDIMSQVDPMAYQQRQMRLAAADRRIGELTGYTPSDFTAAYPNAYTVGNVQQVPAISDLAKQSQQLAGYVSTADLSKKGTDPRLIVPSNPQGFTPIPITQPPSYLT